MKAHFRPLAALVLAVTTLVALPASDACAQPYGRGEGRGEGRRAEGRGNGNGNGRMVRSEPRGEPRGEARGRGMPGPSRGDYRGGGYGGPGYEGPPPGYYPAPPAYYPPAAPVYGYPPPGYGSNSLGAGWGQQQDQARRGVRQGGLLPLGQIIAGLRRSNPGRLLDAGLEPGPDGRPAYRVRWAGAGGRRTDFIVDAASGAIIGQSGY